MDKVKGDNPEDSGKKQITQQTDFILLLKQIRVDIHT